MKHLGRFRIILDLGSKHELFSKLPKGAIVDLYIKNTISGTIYFLLEDESIIDSSQIKNAIGHCTLNKIVEEVKTSIYFTETITTLTTNKMLARFIEMAKEDDSSSSGWVIEYKPGSFIDYDACGDGFLKFDTDPDALQMVVDKMKSNEFFEEHTEDFPFDENMSFNELYEYVVKFVEMDQLFKFSSAVFKDDPDCVPLFVLDKDEDYIVLGQEEYPDTELDDSINIEDVIILNPRSEEYFRAKKEILYNLYI